MSSPLPLARIFGPDCDESPFIALDGPVNRRGWYDPESQPVAVPAETPAVHSVGTNRTERVIGHFQSITMQTAMPFHSGLERDCLQLLDISPEIRRFRAQPKTILYWLDGATHAYTPDALVIPVSGERFMLEVKYRADANRPDNLRRWPAIAERLAAEGFGFAIITEFSLRREPRRRNVQYLQGFRSWEPDPAIAFQLTELLHGSAGLPLGELLPRFANPRKARQHILALVLRRYLAIDLNRPIGPDSAVRLPAIPRTPHGS